MFERLHGRHLDALGTFAEAAVVEVHIAVASSYVELSQEAVLVLVDVSHGDMRIDSSLWFDQRLDKQGDPENSLDLDGHRMEIDQLEVRYSA